MTTYSVVETLDRIVTQTRAHLNTDCIDKFEIRRKIHALVSWFVQSYGWEIIRDHYSWFNRILINLDTYNYADMINSIEHLRDDYSRSDRNIIIAENDE